MKENQFDELAKGMAQSVTRRQALKEFGVGLAGMALACFGLANVAEAQKGNHCLPSGSPCKPKPNNKCCSGVCALVGGSYGGTPSFACQ
jgi:hypothetical protein